MACYTVNLSIGVSDQVVVVRGSLGKKAGAYGFYRPMDVIFYLLADLPPYLAMATASFDERDFIYLYLPCSNKIVEYGIVA